MMLGATLPLLLGAAALGVDVIQLSLAKRQLQRTADTAALAGAHAVAQNKSAAAAVTRVLEVGDQITLVGPPIVNNAPLSGAYQGNLEAVEVELVTSLKLNFIPLFTGNPTQVKARAVAAKVGSSEACILSLDPVAKYGIEMTGNSAMTLNCGIAAKSNHAESIRLTGNLQLDEVSEITAMGGIEVSGNAQVPNAQQFPYSDPPADPYENLASPANSGTCTATNLKLDSGTHVLDPGRYCGFLSIEGSANVTFNPGTYVIAGEYFKINGGPSSSATGNGVTFFLTSKDGKWANMDWDGDTTIDFSAPKKSSGSLYAGVLLMQDRNAPAATKNFLNGNLKLKLRGSLYFPNQWFEWNGNTVTDTDCLRLIGRQLYLNGNIEISNSCTSDDGVLAGGAVKRVRLVE